MMFICLPKIIPIDNREIYGNFKFEVKPGLITYELKAGIVENSYASRGEIGTVKQPPAS